MVTRSAYTTRSRPPSQRLVIRAVGVTLGGGNVAIFVVVVGVARRLRLFLGVVCLLRRRVFVAGLGHGVPRMVMDQCMLAGIRPIFLTSLKRRGASSATRMNVTPAPPA